MRIVLCYPVTDAHVEQIRRSAPQCEVIDAGQQRIDELLPSADIFIGHAKVPVDWDRVLRAKRLKMIQSSAAGLDHCLVPGVIDSDIPVASASGLFAPQVAEQTFALLFGLLRKVKTFIDAETRREFIRRPTDDLRGKTVGIVGLGGNGRTIARALGPWDVKIIATDYYPVRCPDEVSALLPAGELETLLRQSDIVIATLPLNAHTKSLFDADRFAQMQTGVCFINVARGGVVVEGDLVAALDSGQVGSAGLDVTEIEPLHTDSPLWLRDNVLISPHVGAQSARRVDDTTDLACENLKRFFAGQRLVNQVDKQLGFPHPDDSWRMRNE
ncbi:MAG: D-2-hydroxyacid dehydrogenase [Planctomycetota bacterium]